MMGNLSNSNSNLSLRVSKIAFHSENVPFRLKERRHIRDWLTHVITSEKHNPGEISYVFCNDDHLLDMNRSYLEHDYYTDIITFDYVEGNVVSGDLFISIDRVRDNAKTLGHSVREELHRVMVHGLLHLLGYHDKSKEEQVEMRSKEDYYLTLRNF